MPLLKRRDQKKREPFRDATLFIIICEGSDREPLYFEYFDRLSARIKVRAIANENGKSSPKHMEENASAAIKQIVADKGDYKLWIVIDTDHWLKQGQIQPLKKSCDENKWNLAISNPCFEVWLNYHLSTNKPEEKIDMCKTWKSFLGRDEVDFDHNSLPALIETAIVNAKSNYSENGFIPDPGSTQVYGLGEQIWPLVERALR